MLRTKLVSSGLEKAAGALVAAGTLAAATAVARRDIDSSRGCCSSVVLPLVQPLGMASAHRQPCGPQHSTQQDTAGHTVRLWAACGHVLTRLWPSMSTVGAAG
jgi:hypothetical protein